MLNFKNIEIDDIDIYREFTGKTCEFSCESSFVNLLVWQCAYSNMMAVFDGQLFIKSGKGDKESFRLPIGGNVLEGIEKIKEYCGGKYPDFWIQQGENLDNAREFLEAHYDMNLSRDAFDYIYLQSDLAELKGKKYHSKRNHISAFSKKFDWVYEDITSENLDQVRECASLWYAENADKEDFYLLCEKKGIEKILSLMDRLSVKGGALRVDGKIVAFTLGTPINSEVFDVHIEKALKDYSEGYTVINREFARRLGDYKYINREDDMGLEGLRKAKLSYKPAILLEKYHCRKKVNKYGFCMQKSIQNGFS